MEHVDRRLNKRAWGETLDASRVQGTTLAHQTMGGAAAPAAAAARDRTSSTAGAEQHNSLVCFLDAQQPPPPHQKRQPKRAIGNERRPAAFRPRHHPDMTELVDYIHTHEEAFKNQNRLASLYSDFSEQHQTNPEGYAANLNAWKTALEHAARAGKVPGSGQARNMLIIDTGTELARGLQHKQHGLPTCLRAVFLDAIKRNAFVPIDHWETSTQSIYHKSWVKIPKLPTIRGILSGVWELGKTSILGPSNEPPSGSFVLVANVEAAAEAVLAQHRQRPHASTADRVFSKTAFWKCFRTVLDTDATITARDMNVLLVHMARDRQELSYNTNTVKFKADAEDRAPPVTQEDTALAELHDAIEMVKARIVAIQADATKCGLATKEALHLKQMVRAKHCLRKKKMAESSLEHYTNLNLQLEESYSKLQQAADQLGIVEAMKAGAEAMALLNNKVGGVEGVQQVVDAVNDQMATTEEITNIINDSAAPIDENEVDDELAELEKAEKEKQEREEAAKTAALLAELPATKKVRHEEEATKTDSIASQLPAEDMGEEETHEEGARMPMAA
jgi:charged multivesicular body protein 7